MPFIIHFHFTKFLVLVYLKNKKEGCQDLFNFIYFTKSFIIWFWPLESFRTTHYHCEYFDISIYIYSNSSSWKNSDSYSTVALLLILILSIESLLCISFYKQYDCLQKSILLLDHPALTSSSDCLTSISY